MGKDTPMDERKYHPEMVGRMLEGTPREILSFMLNNSGLTRAEFETKSGISWEVLRASLTMKNVMATLKLLGYKLIAIPEANYMLSNVESYQFRAAEERVTVMDDTQKVDFKPLTMEELKQFGVELISRDEMKARIFAATNDDEALSFEEVTRADLRCHDERYGIERDKWLTNLVEDEVKRQIKQYTMTAVKLAKEKLTGVRQSGRKANPNSKNYKEERQRILNKKRKEDAEKGRRRREIKRITQALLTEAAIQEAREERDRKLEELKQKRLERDAQRAEYKARKKAKQAEMKQTTLEVDDGQQ